MAPHSPAITACLLRGARMESSLTSNRKDESNFQRVLQHGTEHCQVSTLPCTSKTSSISKPARRKKESLCMFREHMQARKEQKQMGQEKWHTLHLHETPDSQATRRTATRYPTIKRHHPPTQRRYSTVKTPLSTNTTSQFNHDKKKGGGGNAEGGGILDGE